MLVLKVSNLATDKNLYRELTPQHHRGGLRPLRNPIRL